MIYVLSCNSVIEKAILYTALSIAKPDNFELFSTMTVEDMKKFQGNAIVLKTPVETKEIYDVKTVNKLKRLVKDNKVQFIEIPRYVEKIEAAETLECDELRLFKIEPNKLSLDEQEAPNQQSVGDAFQRLLEENYNTNFIVEL